jgi:hypothetical protein
LLGVLEDVTNHRWPFSEEDNQLVGGMKRSKAISKRSRTMWWDKAASVHALLGEEI